jgi:hypothetical protein
MLVDRDGIVRASDKDAEVGTRESNRHVLAALRLLRRPRGRPGRGRARLRVRRPVQLPGGGYAFEVSYSHQQFDADLAAVRHP